MSTSLAISSAALVQSSAALSAAQHAEHVARCNGVMQRPDLTTTIGRQTYAACVAYVEPVPSAEPVSQSIKVTITVLVLIIFATGLINAWRKRDENHYMPVVGFVMECFMGSAFAGIVIALCIGLIALGQWVLN